MKQLALIALFAAIAVIAAETTAGADEVRVGSVTVGGSGCKGGAESNYENGLITVKLPEFKVVLDAAAESSLVRSPCTLSVPVTVPSGKRLTITYQRLETQLDLPIGSSVNVQIETFFPGTPGAHLRPKIQATSAPIKTTRLIDGETHVQTRCGSGESLRANLSLVMDAKPFKGLAQVSASRLVLTTSLVDCEN